MRFISFFALLCLAFSSTAQTADRAVWLRDQSDCLTLQDSNTKRTCTRIIDSRRLLQSVEPGLVKNKNGHVTHRQIVIVAWDTQDSSHLIWLMAPLRAKPGESFAITTLTPGYQVERVRGTGLYKLEFRVTKNGESLPVYGGKHVWLKGKVTDEKSHKTLSSIVETRQYLPFQDHLRHAELRTMGQSFVLATIAQARRELQAVPSRAYPDRMLTDPYPDTMVSSLIVSEHTDPFKVFAENPAIPPEEYFYGTLTEIAIHGPSAFAELCSSANACGWTQFTNRPKPNKKWPGTYNYAYRECRTKNGEPVLEKDFERGTRDPVNAVKAAFCYLDLENAALPEEARLEFLRDPKQGGVYMLTAYNAGGSWSQKLFDNIKKYRLSNTIDEFGLNHATLPRALFERGKFYNHETHWYIRKYLWLWELLPQLAVQTAPDPNPLQNQNW